MELTKNLVIEKLNDIIVPEVNKPISQYVSELEIKDKTIYLKIDLEKKSSPLKSSLEKVTRKVLSEYTQADYQLNLEIKSEIQPAPKPETKEEPLKGVKNIIAVASGKGGVGKSTVSTNLAIALAKTGAKVGLLDADIYGPSIPTMFGFDGEQLMLKSVGDKNLIIPFEKYGVKVISIGFLVKAEDPLIWRGSMATSAVKQLMNDVDWGELDYFVIDLPPGTGDVPLTMVQTIPVTGAVVVTTPQQVAVVDVVKSIAMFKANKIEVPILGLVENMAWFTPNDAPDKKYFIFGKGGGQKLADKYGIKLLGQMPLTENIVENADSGKPVVLLDDSNEAEIMNKIALQVIEQLNIRNEKLDPTKVVKFK